MNILAIIRNLIAGFVHKHLLHCSGALFHFIFVVIPCWAHAVKGLWKWGACQSVFTEESNFGYSCKDLNGVLPHVLTATDPSTGDVAQRGAGLGLLLPAWVSVSWGSSAVKSL